MKEAVPPVIVGLSPATRRSQNIKKGATSNVPALARLHDSAWSSTLTSSSVCLAKQGVDPQHHQLANLDCETIQVSIAHAFPALSFTTCKANGFIVTPRP